MNTKGPSVWSSCSDHDRVLTLGVEYVVGIGSECSPITEWTPLQSYIDSEVALMEDLQQKVINYTFV